VPGVYLSYPFCSQKCTYCNFASGVFPAALQPRYLERLRDELDSTEWPWTPETVYWGGGTPSLIEPQELAAIHARIPGRPWREATIEAAPGTISREKAEAWREAGIDRVSLGVQSFVEGEIRRTGRKHSTATVEEDVRTLRDGGIVKISIDLIAGLAGQTPQSWSESLDALLRLSPDHASVYMLEVDDDSRLGREMLLGGVRYGASDVPEEGAIAEFYETAVSRLRQAGLQRYEISNFALPGHESVHNLKYWQREPYLGFGADAHSFDGEMRWSNAESPVDYLDGRTGEDRAPSNPDEERFFLGLRLMEGVEAESAPQTRGERAGLLERTGGRLRLTDRGVLLSNEVFAEFLQ
jgi:oxygen-independent coproporphyrinogen-3 oxidase